MGNFGAQFLAEKGQKTPETDWDDKLGKPRIVTPVHFRVFWPKGAKKASDADRLAVKMRIAEVTVVHRLYVSATFPGAASNYLTNANTYSEVADILDGLFDGSA